MGTKSFAVLMLSLGLIQAAPFTQTSGGPTVISDNNTFNIDIVVSDTRTIIGGFNVSLNTFSHTWMGDLTATITHVDTATSTSLFTRPGRLLSASAGAGCAADFNGTYTFIDSAAAGIMNPGCPSTPMAPGSYRASQDNGATDEQLILIADVFNGQSAAGTWRLTIVDNATGDTGSLGSWTLNLDLQDSQSGVPEPATYAVSALGLIAIAALRRKR